MYTYIYTYIYIYIYMYVYALYYGNIMWNIHGNRNLDAFTNFFNDCVSPKLADHHPHGI